MMIKPPRYAVINGDDFGYSDAVNEAIITAYHQGILTNTSLMVTADKTDSAVKLAKENPSLGVGLHLVLCCGKSALHPAQIPHLVDKQGYFDNSAGMAGLKYQFIPQAKQELKEEIKAQLNLFQATGLSLSHVDGHLHLHTHPLVLEILAELASKYEIKFIRLPYEELNFTMKIDSTNLPLKIVYSIVFKLLRKHGEKLLKNHGIKYLDKVYGLLETSKMRESYLLGLIPQIQADIIEIYSHPQSISSDIELDALCSQEVQELLNSNGFQLVNYHQLEEKLSGC